MPQINSSLFGEIGSNEVGAGSKFTELVELVGIVGSSALNSLLECCIAEGSPKVELICNINALLRRLSIIENAAGRQEPEVGFIRSKSLHDG